MAVQQISEKMIGTADGTNAVFNTSKVPNADTISIFVDDAEVAMASVDPNDPTKFTLASPPASGHRPFAVYLFSAADDIDFVTVAQVKGIGEITTSKDDGQLQDLITYFAEFFNGQTGCRVHNRILPITDDPPYDGPGGQKLFLRNYPIRSIQTVMVNGVTLPIAAGRTDGGVVITNNGRAIALRPPAGSMQWSFQSYPLGIGAWQFSQGIANVYVDYTAGNDGTPADLSQATAEQIAIEYKRKTYFDMRSKVQSVGGGSATTTYRDWHLTPKMQRILMKYSRLTV